MKRVADPKLNSTEWWLLDGKIEGLNEWRAEASTTGTSDYSKAIAGLKALDRYTLQISLKQPSEQFLFALAKPALYAVPHEAVERYGQEILNHPVGTGPYKLVEYNPSQARLDRNPTYPWKQHRLRR